MASGHGHGHGHGDGEGPVARPQVARGAGRGRLLFLDAFSGIAGDMLVAAVLDLGVPESVVEDALAALGLPGLGLEHGRRTRSGIVARYFHVTSDGTQPQRTWGQIRTLLENASLNEGTRQRAMDAFARLADAEAAVHGTTPEEVHFHEVGALDSIADIVGAAAALDYLGAEVVSSPLPMGQGRVKAQHGVLPLPAPATVYCLRGVPTYDGGVEAELVTPTGACLVATTASRFARWPAMRPERVGWGAGTRELPDRPNLLRVVLGEPEAARGEELGSSPFVVLEANVDDLTGELAAHALEEAFAAGALDAWTIPIGMKKGRPAFMLCALARRAASDAVAQALLRETSSLGVRVRPADRIERPRRIVEVTTRFGPIAVKVADGDGLPVHAAPEFEACRAAAEAHGVPLKEVYAEALLSFRGSEG